MTKEISGDRSALDTICLMGPDFDFWFGIGICSGLAISLALVLQKRIKMGSFWIILVLATLASLWWREFQLAEVHRYAGENAGFDPTEAALDRYFIHSRSLIRFGAITVTLTIGMIIHFIRNRRLRDSSQKAPEV